MTADLIAFILKSLGDQADGIKDMTVDPGVGDFATYRHAVGLYAGLTEAAAIVQNCWKTFGKEDDDE